MDQYIDKDIKSTIKTFKLHQGVSKDNKPYIYAELVFINGFSKRLFFRSGEEFGLMDSIRQLKDKEEESDLDKMFNEV